MGSESESDDGLDLEELSPVSFQERPVDSLWLDSIFPSSPELVWMDTLSSFKSELEFASSIFCFFLSSSSQSLKEN